MLTEEEQLKLQHLCNENPELDTLITRMNEENRFLFSKISHEIRNPLTLISSTLQLMETKYPIISESKYWNQIMYDIKDLGLLLNDLSMFNNSSNLIITDVDLSKLITEAKNSYSLEAKKRNINLIIQTHEIVEKYISNYPCDSVKIREVLSNVIKNAFDAIGTNGSIMISIDMNSSPDYNGSLDSYVAISISNDAKMIPDDEVAHIFTPFITYKDGGTGLGLALSSDIITAHGGSIQVQSNEALTTFTIFLPLNSK